MVWLRKFGRRTLWVAVFCLVAGCFFYFTQNFWFEQIRAYCIGRLEIQAEKSGRYLPETDEVEVILLGGLKNTQGFVETDLSEYSVLGQTTLRGDDAKKASDCWRWMPRGRQYGALCFQPAYALRFKKDNKLLLETAVCWHCSIYTMPLTVGFWNFPVEYGFDSRSKAAQDLLNLLEQKLPPPGSPSKK
jgi:hypothetical protein